MLTSLKLRFAVKDLIDVAGLQTGCGNRSFRCFYPKKTASASFIEQLINAGAVLIGKTKTSQFADGQEPSQWFDRPIHLELLLFEIAPSLSFLRSRSREIIANMTKQTHSLLTLRASEQAMFNEQIFCLVQHFDFPTCFQPCLGFPLIIFIRFDYLAPFNPRGDGYQKPSSSSTGSAVACAGYNWLDFAIGTDTGGSIRHPAGVNGIYGTRSSLNAVVGNSFSVSPLLDSFGVFARSASMLEAASAVMFSPSFKMAVQPKVKPRYKLLYPIRAETSKGEGSFCWFPHPNNPGKAAAAEAQFESFVQKLEQHLGCPRSVLNLDDLWDRTRPAGQSEDLHKATGKIYQQVAYCSYVRETIDPFIADYQAAHDGRKPFIEPLVQARQEYGRQITTSEYEEAVESLKMFSNWVLDVLFATSDAAEIPLLLFPQSWGRPDYRTIYPAKDSPVFWDRFSLFSLSYCSGCPDYTVPISEVSYHSRVTDHEEWLPISLSMLGRPGVDVILLGLLRELEEGGILRSPAVGVRMFP